MSMMMVPSLERGSRTLPPYLRGYYGAADRLHPMLAGLGTCQADGTDDVTGDACIYFGAQIDPNQGQVPTESPYPVVFNDPTPVTATVQLPNGTTQSQTMTASQLAALISAGASSLTKVLAVTQGGTVMANGTIIGSPTAAQVAASQSALSVSTAGLSGLLANPMVAMLGLGLVVLLVSRR